MLRISNPGLGLTCLGLSYLSLVSGCGQPAKNDVVTINYEQVGACNGFENGSGVTSAGPRAAFVIFRISNIVNNASAARNFDFDPNLLFINGSSPREFASTTLNLAKLNPFAVQARFVAKGTTETLNGAAVVTASTVAVDGASEANKSSYMLAYETPAGGQGVALAKKDPARTSWPSTPDCTDVIY